jgi:hypothetical protein
MSKPDQSLTPFSIAFSWQGKLQFFHVIPYRVDQYTIYRVMKGQDCYAVYTLKEGQLSVSSAHASTSAIPASLHHAIGDELEQILDQKPKQEQKPESREIRFFPVSQEYEILYNTM